MAISHEKIAKLVARVKRRDSQAVTELYEMTYQKIYYVSYQVLRDQFDAQDAVQETFIKVLASLDALEDDKLFIAWANKIAYNICLRILAKRKDGSITDEQLNQISGDDKSDPFLKAVKSEKHRVLMNHISELDTDLRATILFKYFHDMKIREIAVVMDCPEGTVKSRLNTAKRQLREMVNKKGTGDILLGAFGFLPLRQALRASASGVGLPPDVALDTLINALGTNNFSTNVAFTPQGTNNSSTPSRGIIRVALVAVGIGGTAVVTGVLLVSPRITNVSLPEPYINTPAAVTAYVRSLGRLDSFYAVSEETKARYEGHLTEEGQYQVELPENGVYTLYAVGQNKQQVTAQVAITCIDKELPAILDYSHTEQQIKITVQDDLAGVDFGSIYGENGDGTILRPVKMDEENGQVYFDLPDSDFKLYLADKAGNLSRNQVTIRWR